MFATSLEWSFPVYFFLVCNFFGFFPSRLFAAIRVRGAVLLVSFQALEIFYAGVALWNLEGWCFYPFVKSLENFWRHYAAVRQGQLVAMRHGTNFFIYGMHVSTILLQKPAPNTWSDITYKHS